MSREGVMTLSRWSGKALPDPGWRGDRCDHADRRTISPAQCALTLCFRRPLYPGEWCKNQHSHKYHLTPLWQDIYILSVLQK
jgi:hypothetical protein